MRASRGRALRPDASTRSMYDTDSVPGPAGVGHATRAVRAAWGVRCSAGGALLGRGVVLDDSLGDLEDGLFVVCGGFA
jgi:hypothetical protein